MTRQILANELLDLRRQIARLQQREAQIVQALASDEAEAPPRRPGWPIHRLPAPVMMGGGQAETVEIAGTV